MENMHRSLRRIFNRPLRWPVWIAFALLPLAAANAASPDKYLPSYQVACSSHFAEDTVDCADYYDGLPIGPGQSVYQPPSLSFGDQTTALIYQYGFAGMPEANHVKGVKVDLFENEYYATLAVTVPDKDALITLQDFSPYTIPGYGVAQYFDLSEEPAFENLALNHQFNLCGPLLASTIVETDPMDLLLSMAEQPQYENFFTQEDEGLYYFELMSLFNQYGWETELKVGVDSSCRYARTAGRDNRSLLGIHTRCNLSRWLEWGNIVVAGVNLVTDPRLGIAIPEHYPAAASSTYTNTAHYVAVLALIESKDGSLYVRVYNPFQNREEIYRWNDFFLTWMRGTHELAGISVIVTPP